MPNTASDTLRLPARLLRHIEQSDLPPVVVIGTDVTGLALARAVEPFGPPVIGVDAVRRTPTSWSRAFTWLRCPELHGPRFLDFLESLAAALPRRAVLFLSMDEHVKLVASALPLLRSLFAFDFPTPEAVQLLMSKERFGRYAEAKGWPVPRTVFCRSDEELEGAVETLSFPVILKPQVKNLVFRTYSSQKSYKCTDADALRRAWREVSQWEPEVVVQEWVSGGDDAIWFSLHYHDAELREVGGFEGRKLRQWIPECGSTSMATGVAVSHVADLSRTILSECGCAGFGAVEYKRDARTGEFRIMEPTVGRVNLQVGVAQANGVNYVARAYFHLIGQPYPVEERPRHDVKWVLGGSDFRSARFYIGRGDLTWREYLSSVRGPKEWAVWRWTDTGVMAASARQLAKAPLRWPKRFLRH